MNSNESSLPPSPPSAATDGKTVAIVSYLTLIGFIVAVILNGSAKTRLGAYHLRQSLGLMLASIALMIVGGILMMIPFLGWLITMCGWLGLFVLWVMGLVAAANGQFKPVPLVGEQFQKWFGTAFE